MKNDHNEQTKAQDLEHAVTSAPVLDAIKCGKVQMRPRWFFLLQTALAVMGAGFLLFGLISAASMVLFMVRHNGSAVVPGFGPYGWWSFLLMLPWGWIIGTVVALAFLEVVLRRSSCAYRQPVIYTLAGVFALAVVCTIIVDRMQIHEGLRDYSARRGYTSIDRFYRGMERNRPCCITQGTIVEQGGSTYVIAQEDGTVVRVQVGDWTRFPEGRNFATSNMVVLFGEQGDDGMITARGMRLWKQ